MRDAIAIPKSVNAGPIYGVTLIRDLPVGGMLQAMPSRSDLEQVKAINERTVAGYEVLLSHYVAIKDRAEKLESMVECAIRNASSVDDTSPKDEPGPMCGPTWAKVAHLFGLGSSSAVDLCHEYEVDPHFNCSKSR
jgi:hypothetical protein